MRSSLPRTNETIQVVSVATLLVAPSRGATAALSAKESPVVEAGVAAAAAAAVAVPADATNMLKPRPGVADPGSTLAG